MGRPPSINEVLSNAARAKKSIINGDGDGSFIKPKFLSKNKRNELATFIKSNSRSSPDPEMGRLSKREMDSDDAHIVSDALNHSRPDRSASSHKRPKFQFEWQDSDDTMSDYKAIVATSVASLLPNRDESGSLENSYMGRHWREKSLKEMTERDWRIFKEDYDIKTKGGSIINPMRSWDELDLLGKDMLDIITKDLKYEEPTAIQRVAIPNVCSRGNRDFLGVASTGSGKTLAFIIPILIKMSSSQPRPLSLKTMEGPKALILAPTRELAQQIQNEAQKITVLWNSRNQSQACKVVSIVGGHSLQDITNQLSQGFDILVATPGRLIESMENHMFSYGQIETLILDEADKMIDMGFEDQVTTILSKLNAEMALKKRQTLMFTATMSPTIERIANGYLTKPGYATVGGGEESVPQIQQLVQYAPSEEQRFKKIKSLLNSYRPPIIIFITYKKTADWLAQKFYKETNFQVTILHGSKSQEQREHSLQQLRSGKFQIMIATNVAARGLDIPNVSLVVNFQISKTLDDYIHRIGRTGRAGNQGTAITYMGDEENLDIVHELFKYVETNNPTRSNNFDPSLKSKYKLGKSKLDEILY